MTKPWAGGGGTVGDGGAVKYDGLRRSRSNGFERGAFGDADLDFNRAVVERQIAHVGALAGIEPGDRVGGRGFFRAGDIDPLPGAFVESVKINSADTGSWHVREGNGFVADGVANLNGRRIRVEPESNAGTVAAETPNRRADDFFRFGGKSVITRVEIGREPALSFDSPFRDIAPDGRVGDLFRCAGRQWRSDE